MIATDDDLLTERVGQLDFAVRRGDPGGESADRWDRRVDALTAWLLAEWRREQKGVARA
jgi:hypothetical protein